MNADTASPATPTPPPPPGPVPAPGATTPPGHGAPAEPNALMEWSRKAWAGLKEGKVGNPRILALVLAVVAIGVAWWFLARSSKQADSALWTTFNLAVNEDRIDDFVEQPSVKDTVAARIAKLNKLRLVEADALRNLTSPTFETRQAAADSLEKLRGELETAAGQFPNDPTLTASAYLAAAEAEMGLIGVPKKGVTVMGVDVKGNCRGQVEKYIELMKKAAEAIGPNTDAGKKFTATAENYSKDLEASELYARLGTFHAKFNNPDPLPDPVVPPTGTDPNAPKPPTSIPGDSTAPTGPTDGPKPPAPLDPDPAEKK